MLLSAFSVKRKTLIFLALFPNMKYGFKIFVIACWALCAVCLTSCHQSLVKPNSVPIYYSDSGYINLLPTQAMSGSLDGLQHLEGTFSKDPTAQGAQEDTSSKTFSGEVWVRANDTLLSITLMSGFGTTIAELTYAKDSVSFASSLIDVEKMKAEYVLADFQACFYPFDALKKNFEKHGFVFTEKRSTEDGNPDFERVLSENGNVIFRITRKANEIVFENVLRHYAYHITLGND